MPKIIKALSANEVKIAKSIEKDFKLADGGGLYLLVKTTGAKYWRMNYKHPITKKSKTLSFGVYPEVSLKRAREKRSEARKLLGVGIDPIEQLRADKVAQADTASNTFKVVADKWFDKRVADKSKSHRERTKRLLERDLYPYLCNRPINDITPAEMLAVLERVEKRTVETARRARQVASQIYRFAINSALATSDPAAYLGESLKAHTVKHRPAITDPAEVGKLMLAIDGYKGSPVGMAALKLSPLLFCRPGELRHLEWPEINWEQKRIEIPAAKMKMREDHIIPLATQAIEMLRELQPLTERRGKYVFPSVKGASQCLSENGVRTALRTLGFDNETMTPHGFRAMARTLLDEVLSERIEHIEQQLAHAVKDANGRAYNRTRHLPQRAEMMQRWADYLDVLKDQARCG